MSPQKVFQILYFIMIKNQKSLLFLQNLEGFPLKLERIS